VSKIKFNTTHVNLKYIFKINVLEFNICGYFMGGYCKPPISTGCKEVHESRFRTVLKGLSSCIRAIIKWKKLQ
jgi:hypothetical protein